MLDNYSPLSNRKFSHYALTCFFENPYTHRYERPQLPHHIHNFSQITTATLQTGYFLIDLDQFLLSAHVKDRGRKCPLSLDTPLFVQYIHEERSLFSIAVVSTVRIAVSLRPIAVGCGYSTCRSGGYRMSSNLR